MSVARAPRVSVIMNCYNCSRYLKDAIDSVFIQTYKDWEIVFWDNNSSDGSSEIVSSYKSDKICYFKWNETVVLGLARNFAIEKARGEYIAFLDCDDEWEVDKLEKTIHLLEERPEIGMVFSNGVNIDVDGNIIVSEQFETRKCKIDTGSKDVFYHELAQDFIGCPLGVVFRKECIESVGYFDSEFEMAEEYELYLKIIDRYKIEYIPDSLYRYRVHSYSPSIQKQHILAAELLRILEYWLKKKPELKKEYKYYADVLRFKIFFTLIYHHFRFHEFRKVIKITFDFLMAFKFNLILIGNIIKDYYSIERLIRFFKRWKKRRNLL